jgi:hypothetical protein
VLHRCQQQQRPCHPPGLAKSLTLHAPTGVLLGTVAVADQHQSGFLPELVFAVSKVLPAGMTFVVGLSPSLALFTMLLVYPPHSHT